MSSYSSPLKPVGVWGLRGDRGEKTGKRGEIVDRLRGGMEVGVVSSRYGITTPTVTQLCLYPPPHIRSLLLQELISDSWKGTTWCRIMFSVIPASRCFSIHSAMRYATVFQTRSAFPTVPIAWISSISIDGPGRLHERDSIYGKLH